MAITMAIVRLNRPKSIVWHGADRRLTALCWRAYPTKLTHPAKCLRLRSGRSAISTLSQQKTMRVLLVEDDPMIGKSVQQGLRQDGYTVDWVRDGRAAETALATTPYELLLLDLGLPGKSGLEVLARLRRSLNGIPVLVITARDAIADRIKGLDTLSLIHI